ncbi:hypothetical protein MRX96_008778 [Rhipicephalus microplus]|uniref:uncharacterized protein LOC119186656 n=1 Tax=Rhipicephalus microplus TaxID=6941 RepID=UPI003F6C73E7
MDSWVNSQATPTGDRQLHRHRWRLALRGRPRPSLLASTRPATTSWPRQRQLVRPQSDHADQPAHGRRHPVRACLWHVAVHRRWLKNVARICPLPGQDQRDFAQPDTPVGRFLQPTGLQNDCVSGAGCGPLIKALSWNLK